MGTFSHRETSSRTGYRVSPLRASLAKTMGLRTGQPPPQHHKPLFVEGIWFLREAKPSVASRRREKRQERAKLRHGLGVNSLVLWQSRDAEFVANQMRFENLLDHRAERNLQFEFQESCFPSWSISQSLYYFVVLSCQRFKKILMAPLSCILGGHVFLKGSNAIFDP